MLVAAAFAACGATDRRVGTNARQADSTEATSTASSAPGAVGAGDYVSEDGDKDYDDRPGTRADQDDQLLLAHYPRRASRPEARRILALVKRYYAVSVAGNAAGACALLTAQIAGALAASETSGTRGGRCAAAFLPLLHQQQPRLAVEQPATMTVSGVHLSGRFALVVLRFRRSPESQTLLERERGAWKIDSLFDGLMP